MGYTNGLLSALSHAQNGVPLTDLAYRYDVDGQLIGIDDLLDPSKSKGIAMRKRVAPPSQNRPQ